jgi:hypothetical protein
MSSTTRDFLDALVALSDNPLFTEAREKLLEDLSDNELGSLINICLEKNMSRAEHREVALLLLDITARHTKARVNGSRAAVSQVSERTSNNRKRPRSEKEERKAESAHRQTTPLEGPAMTHEVYNLSSDEDGNYEGGQIASDLGAGGSKSEKAIPEIEKMICVPDEHGNTTWKPCAKLPSQLANSILAKFDNDYMSTERHRTIYSMMLRNRYRSVEGGRCVNLYVCGKSSKLAKWTMADGNKDRTCDGCINTGRLCARLVDSNGMIKMLIYPLPSSFSVGKAWHELEYWVRGGI